MLDITAIAIASTIAIGLCFEVLRLRLKIRGHVAEIVQLAMDKSLLLKMVEQNMIDKESANIEKTDGFLKFVSDSRDWAFTYIEEVQNELREFSSVVGPELKYLNTFGKSVSTPHDGSIDKIFEAYNKLEKLLPMEDKK